MTDAQTSVETPEPPAAPPSPPAPRRRAWLRFAAPYIAVAAIAATVLLLSKPWDKPDRYEPGTAARREAEQLGALDPNAPKRGERAPDFVLRSLDGQTMRLSELRGRIVVVNFWATWCGPCRGEMPELQWVYERNKDRDLVILGVNVEGLAPEDARRAAQDFRDWLGITFPIVLDSPNGDVFHQYRLYGLPDSFIVDGEGIIRDVRYGSLNRDDLLSRIDAIRKDRPDAER
ncbi:MAG: TlpA family protein disulfide reductase [Chloroflexi bacterium]|nr:TlpA family protein disulfide reductase [Chloroflexota bacterium]